MTGAADTTTTAAISAVMASYRSKAAAIIVLTTSGATAHTVSKYKPHCPILTVTRYRSLTVYSGNLYIISYNTYNLILYG